MKPGLSRDVRFVTFGESVEGMEFPLECVVGCGKLVWRMRTCSGDA